MADDKDDLRCFIALNFPLQVIEAASEIVAQLAKVKGRITWVKHEGVHLTLKFLGDVPVYQLDVIKQKLAECTAGITPFNLQVTELGVFPNHRQPRVIWWGITCDSPQLDLLYQNIEKQMNQCGFPLENRAFTPHLTLGRIRELSHPHHLIDMVQKVSLPQLPPILIQQVDLMQSTLINSGSVYKKLASFEFPG